MNKVSIVLPTYNGSEFLSQSIESVLCQTYANFELIIVDDCSTDETGKIADDYSRKDSRVRVIHNERNQKLPASLNIGFKHATGDYWTWTSDDNWYEPQAIARMVSYLTDNPEVGLVAADFRKIQDGMSSVVEISVDKVSLLKDTIGACFLYRAEVAKRVGEYNSEKFLVEDYDFWLRMGLEAEFGKISEVLYNYRVHANSLTGRRMKDILDAKLRVKIEMLPKYIERFPTLDYTNIRVSILLDRLQREKSAVIISELKPLIGNRELVKVLKKFYKHTNEKFYLKAISSLGGFWCIAAKWYKFRYKKNVKIRTSPLPATGSLRSIDELKDLALERSLNWIENNTIKGEGIIVNSQERITYPEVTGYYIPTLLRYGMKERARSYAAYLVSSQNKDGSWNEPSGRIKYTFDTAQILKGLCEFAQTDASCKQSLLAGCDWLLTQQREDGSLATPDYTWWALPYGKRVPEYIHLYCLEPLYKTANMFGIEKYRNAADKAKRFYMACDDLTDFMTLSHFNAYVIEALIDIGESERARQAMNQIAMFQNEQGAVPAYSHVKFVCSTGLFQYAICWYKLGDKLRGDRAFKYAINMQNRTGGWFGSYGAGANYFPEGEISWAVKYFLDANWFRGR